MTDYGKVTSQGLTGLGDVENEDHDQDQDNEPHEAYEQGRHGLQESEKEIVHRCVLPPGRGEAVAMQSARVTC